LCKNLLQSLSRKSYYSHHKKYIFEGLTCWYAWKQKAARTDLTHSSLTFSPWLACIGMKSIIHVKQIFLFLNYLRKIFGKEHITLKIKIELYTYSRLQVWRRKLDTLHKNSTWDQQQKGNDSYNWVEIDIVQSFLSGTCFKWWALFTEYCKKSSHK